MKKFYLIVFVLQFSFSSFSQTDTKHHYTDLEVSKLTGYIAELEKKLSLENFDGPAIEDRKQTTALLSDASHNYYDEDIIKIYKYIKDLEKKAAINNLMTMSVLEIRNDSIQTAILLVKGTLIFKDSASLHNYSTVSITVTDKQSNEIVGVYTPNSKSGKYLFILNPGKKYLIKAESNGYQKYTEDFFPANKTESYEIAQEISLKKE